MGMCVCVCVWCVYLSVCACLCVCVEGGGELAGWGIAESGVEEFGKDMLTGERNAMNVIFLFVSFFLTYFAVLFYRS